jgi:ABC-type phosphate/phosphonate transport system permease subunit
VGIGTIVGGLAVFFGCGTVLALLLCASNDDADRRMREAIETDAARLQREADELVLR